MTETETPIQDDEWRTIVANVPLVSVDLVIEHDGGVLLGERENEPGKGEWFVPGGTVFKNESRTDAVHRVAEEELGESVVIDGCLGTYEHFYETGETAASELLDRYENAAEQLDAGYPQTPIGKRSRRNKLTKLREYDLIVYEGPPQKRVYRVLDSELESVTELVEVPT